jgi:tetratricopeptide (TPR) repeat protein
MTDPFVRRLLIGLSLATAFVLPAPRAALAEDAVATAASEAQPEPSAEPARKKTRKEERAERKQQIVNPRTSRTFGKVREHLDAERYAEAEEALGKLRLDKLSPYERAQTHRLYGYTTYGQQHNDAAIEHLRKSLAEADGLAPADRADVLFQIAQIQGVERRWQDVIATLETWFQTVERPNSVGYFLMALAYYQLEDFDGALLPAKKAVEIAKKPQQAWLQLLLAIHLTRKDFPAATRVLDEMIALYPNAGKDYWLQLSALHGVTADEARALGVLEIAYQKGVLTEDRDLRRLLQMMLARGIPHRAATIFEKAMAEQRFQQDPEALELLSIAWILAREATKAEEPLARAAELAAKGELYVRLAQIHLMQEEWDEAVAALRKGLAKGGLGDPGTAQLLLGIAYYNERNLPEARSWFAHAQRSAGTRAQAQSWLEHIDRELAEGSAGGTAG